LLIDIRFLGLRINVNIVQIFASKQFQNILVEILQIHLNRYFSQLFELANNPGYVLGFVFFRLPEIIEIHAVHFLVDFVAMFIFPFLQSVIELVNSVHRLVIIIELTLDQVLGFFELVFIDLLKILLQVFFLNIFDSYNIISIKLLLHLFIIAHLISHILYLIIIQFLQIANNIFTTFLQTLFDLLYFIFIIVTIIQTIFKQFLLFYELVI